MHSFRVFKICLRHSALHITSQQMSHSVKWRDYSSLLWFTVRRIQQLDWVQRRMANERMWPNRGNVPEFAWNYCGNPWKLVGVRAEFRTNHPTASEPRALRLNESDRCIKWLINWKGCGRKRWWPTFRRYPHVFFFSQTITSFCAKTGVFLWSTKIRRTWTENQISFPQDTQYIQSPIIQIIYIYWNCFSRPVCRVRWNLIEDRMNNSRYETSICGLRFKTYTTINISLVSKACSDPQTHVRGLPVLLWVCKYNSILNWTRASLSLAVICY